MRHRDLSGIVEDTFAIVDKFQPYISIIRNVAEDPALPEVMAKVQAMRDQAAKDAAAKAASAKAAGTPAPASTPAVGIGLKKFVAPLGAIVWIQAHPKTTIALGVGGLLAIGGIGYLIGRKVARKKAGLGGLDWPPPDPKRCRKIAEQIDSVASARNRAQHRGVGGETLYDYKRRLDALTASYDRAGC